MAVHGAKVLFGMALRSNKQPATGTIALESSAFGNNAVIPRKYSGEAENVSPPLSWSGVPAAAAELVLLCEDPDAPFPQPYLHWLAYGISPRLTGLEEGVPAVESPGIGGMKQAKNAAKEFGYTGPMPPPGHGVHHYHFQLFALDRQLALSGKVEREQLLEAMKGHVLAEGTLVGTYERK
jgi:Raf kinase inhibitor-like YbhB/YbcL family protein